MQHTLLPRPQKLALRREYRVRAATVACFVFSIVGLIGIGSLFPAFIHASIQERTQLNAVASIKKAKDADNLNQIDTDLVRDAALLAVLAQSSNTSTFSGLIEKIISLRKDNRLTSLTIAQAASPSVRVTLQGIAPTRESLLAFKSRLEGAFAGSKIDLPISQLAKSSDIQFSLQVISLLP